MYGSSIKLTNLKSELDFQAELHLPRIQGVRDLPEGGRVHVLSGRAEVRMIECIEEFRAPLHGPAFSNPVEVDRPADNEVEVLERRSRNVVATGVSERAERLLLHGLLVEPLSHGARSLVDVSHDVGAAEVVQGIGLIARNQSRERPSGLKGDDTRYFPIPGKYVGA